MVHVAHLVSRCSRSVFANRVTKSETVGTHSTGMVIVCHNRPKQASLFLTLAKEYATSCGQLPVIPREKHSMRESVRLSSKLTGPWDPGSNVQGLLQYEPYFSKVSSDWVARKPTLCPSIGTTYSR